VYNILFQTGVLEGDYLESDVKAKYAFWFRVKILRNNLNIILYISSVHIQTPHKRLHRKSTALGTRLLHRKPIIVIITFVVAD